MVRPLVENATIDDLWQVLMLVGVMNRTPMHREMLSCEAPQRLPCQHDHRRLRAAWASRAGMTASRAGT